MLDQLSAQPVWIQVVIGLFVFFGSLWLVSTIITGYIEIRERADSEAHRRKHEEEASREQSKRERELAEAEPSLLEEAMFVRWGRKRSIYSIREQLNAMPQYARDNIASSLEMQDLFEEIRSRRGSDREA